MKKTVSIIGSGPSGLECARICASAGLKVSVYEAMPKFGGALRYGIPSFRLRKATIDKKVDNLKAQGVAFFANTRVENLSQIEADSIFLGAGADVPRKLGITGEDRETVLSSIKFLEEYNSGIKRDFVGKKVLVIGAGNVAMDASRVAVKLGAKSVAIVYRKTIDKAPCNDIELINAREEGVVINELMTPIEITDDTLVCETKAETTPSVIADYDPQSHNECDNKTEIADQVRNDGDKKTVIKVNFPYDIIITAIGQSPDKMIDDRITTDDRGRVVVDDNMMTNVKGVYAGGDVVRGPETIRQAILDGQKAGKAIVAALGE